jgi:hypothetical protein
VSSIQSARWFLSGGEDFADDVGAVLLQPVFLLVGQRLSAI